MVTSLSQKYGNSIIENSSYLDDMKISFWAIWFHKASSDGCPIYETCPKGSNSRCLYGRVEELKLLKNGKHDRFYVIQMA